MPFLIRDLFLPGVAGGLNCLFYAQTQLSSAAAAENWFCFVEKGHPGGRWLVNPKPRQLIDMKTDLNLTDFWVCEDVTFKYVPDISWAKT